MPLFQTVFPPICYIFSWSALPSFLCMVNSHSCCKTQLKCHLLWKLSNACHSWIHWPSVNTSLKMTVASVTPDLGRWPNLKVPVLSLSGVHVVKGMCNSKFYAPLSKLCFVHLVLKNFIPKWSQFHPRNCWGPFPWVFASENNPCMWALIGLRDVGMRFELRLIAYSVYIHVSKTPYGKRQSWGWGHESREKGYRTGAGGQPFWWHSFAAWNSEESRNSKLEPGNPCCLKYMFIQVVKQNFIFKDL